MSLLPSYSSLSSWLDRWTGRWNRKASDTIRSRMKEFFSRWRSREGNWFQTVAQKYFQLLHEHPELGPPSWNPEFQGDIQKLHFTNHTIWHLEQEARRSDIPSESMVEVKRGMDAVGVKRKDQMERIDSRVAKRYGKQLDDETLPIHSEPPAAMLNRLSMMSLNMYHDRANPSESNGRNIHRRRNDLGRALDRFRTLLGEGRIRFKAYRNDISYEQLRSDSALKG